MEFKDLIYKRRKELGLTMEEVANECNVSKATVKRWESGEIANIRRDKIAKLAKALHTAPAYLMGWEDFEYSAITSDFQKPTISTDNVEFAVIGDVAAGFDKVAIEDWTGDKILIPSSYLKSRSRDNFFVLRVKGNSMYPEYRDGDKVLILKQNAVDYSGQIAVAIYDDELGTIKKIEYKKDSVHLVPINPQYEPEVIKGTDIEKIHILGIPKLLIREIEE